MTPRHKRLCMERSRKYMKTHMKFVLFTGESRASLVGLVGLAKGCVSNCDNCPTTIGVNKVVIWDGMIRNKLIGPFRVLEVLKLSADTSCAFLEYSLEPWLDNLSLVRLKKIIFMYDNALSHAGKTGTQFLTLFGFVTKP